MNAKNIVKKLTSKKLKEKINAIIVIIIIIIIIVIKLIKLLNLAI